MNYAKLLSVSIITFLLANCATPPKPDLCGIIGPDLAACTPTDPEKPEYDLKIIDMIGYTCMSPKDTGDMKKYIKKLLEQID